MTILNNKMQTTNAHGILWQIFTLEPQVIGAGKACPDPAPSFYIRAQRSKAYQFTPYPHLSIP